MTTLNVLFKSMQKDDKKEVLKFVIQGDEDDAIDLFDLSGSIVSLALVVGGDQVGQTLNAEFVNIQRDSKKTVMKFDIKSDGESKSLELYKFAGRNVELTVKPSQMSIEEFREEPREGVRGTINPDGTVDADQASIDDYEEEDQDSNPMHDQKEDIPFSEPEPDGDDDGGDEESDDLE